MDFEISVNVKIKLFGMVIFLKVISRKIRKITTFREEKFLHSYITQHQPSPPFYFQFVALFIRNFCLYRAHLPFTLPITKNKHKKYVVIK